MHILMLQSFFLTGNIGLDQGTEQGSMIPNERRLSRADLTELSIVVEIIYGKD